MKRLLALSTVLVLSACGGTATEIVTPSPTETHVPAPTVTAGPGDGNDPDAEAPTFAPAAQLTFQSVDVMSGEPINGIDYAGQNVVFWFWAPWCPTCQFESVQIRELLTELPDDVQIVGVAALDVPEEFPGFVEDYGLTGMRHIQDKDAEIWSAFGIAANSSYAFVSANGDVEVHQGSMPRVQLTERIQELSSQ